MIRWIEEPDGWFAEAEIRVGVSRHHVRLPLGRLAAAPDPGGLRQSPVLVVEAAFVSFAWAGAVRAGRSPSIGLLAADEEHAGSPMLGSVAGGAEILVVPDGGPGTLIAARALDGRPVIPAPLQAPSIFDGLDVDVHIAVPSGEHPHREAIRAILAPLELEGMHHLVEVDPAPAFEELGLDMREASLDELAAGAAGVLCGRLAATNRRWRAEP